jgi:hypothetical protein
MPQFKQTAAFGGVGCPQLGQKFMPAPFWHPHFTHMTASSVTNCAPQFLQNILFSSVAIYF